MNILGIRGLPAAHGGFETFASHLAPYLRDRGWAVNVYCQDEIAGGEPLPMQREDELDGIRRIHVASRPGSAGSLAFDWHCVRDARGRGGVNLVLGYNTAAFTLMLRASGRPVVMNMDGVEWLRAKWSLPVRAWFYVNEFVGANFTSQPVADHPEIARHLRRHGCRRAEVILYGSDAVECAPSGPVTAMGLEPDRYFLSINRIEPENSVLEIVRAFSARQRTGKLVVLGRLDPTNAYHRAVRSAAADTVRFPGAIYDRAVVSALRFHCRAYAHGHQVGGTNPSLVEALGAGNAVIAHDNRFNRWVAGASQFYFSTTEALEVILSGIDSGEISTAVASMAARHIHRERFALDRVLGQYEALLRRFV